MGDRITWERHGESWFCSVDGEPFGRVLTSHGGPSPWFAGINVLGDQLVYRDDAESAKRVVEHYARQHIKEPRR